MLKKDTYEFLKAIKDNNNREWFLENKVWYEQSRSDFELLVAEIITKIATFDTQIGELDPRKCIFRIYRDTRFSTDKTPYKDHFGAVFRPQGLGKTSGYYLHISAEESFLTCGHYMLLPDQLKKVRRGIYEDYELFRSILDEPDFTREIGDLYRDGDLLKRVPNGFDKNNPAAEYLKLKHFYVLKAISEKEILTENFVDYAGNIYKMMQPLGHFLNDLLLE